MSTQILKDEMDNTGHSIISLDIDHGYVETFNTIRDGEYLATPHRAFKTVTIKGLDSRGTISVELAMKLNRNSTTVTFALFLASYCCQQMSKNRYAFKLSGVVPTGGFITHSPVTSNLGTNYGH